jgi:hypothetical protein
MKTIKVDKIYWHNNSLVIMTDNDSGTIIYNPKFSKVIDGDTIYDTGENGLEITIGQDKPENRIKLREGE